MSMDTNVVLPDVNGVVTARAYIGIGDLHGRGVPFVFYVGTDRAPFPLYLVIEVKGASGDAIEISSLMVVHGQEREQSNLKELHGKDRYSVDMDNNNVGEFLPSKQSVLFVFPTAVRRANACRIEINGSVVSTGENTNVPFQIELYVPFERCSGWTTGWMKLLYYDQF